MVGSTQDWVTIWHSEMAALAVDREQQEAVLRGVDAWGAVAALMAVGLDAAGRAGADAAAGAAAADAASDARVLALERRVAELEARLGRK